MIIKQIKGTSFEHLLEYLLSKDGATTISTNMGGETPQSLAREFNQFAKQNRRVKRPVYHVSFSLAPNEQLSDADWIEIIDYYLTEMGFAENQYLLVRHCDRDHDHVHLVANRVSADKTCVHDGWDYRRSERLAREIEQAHSLTPTVSSWEKDQRSPSTGEWRLQHQRHQTSARIQLQQIINEQTQDHCTFDEFVERLNEQQVDVMIGWTRTGKSKGICYRWQNYRFSGTQLGRAYTFRGIQLYRGVEYDPDQTEISNQNLKPEQNDETDQPSKITLVPQPARSQHPNLLAMSNQEKFLLTTGHSLSVLTQTSSPPSDDSLQPKQSDQLSLD